MERCERQAPLPFFELDLVVLLRVAARGLATDLHGGVGGLSAKAYLGGRGAVIIAYLQKRADLVALDPHRGVIVDGVGVYLGP